jgi:hypothetical protein
MGPGAAATLAALNARNAQEQKEELAKRACGQGSHYSWSFDENGEIYEADLDGEIRRKLTDAVGCDAEGSWSPDGSRIVWRRFDATEPAVTREDLRLHVTNLAAEAMTARLVGPLKVRRGDADTELQITPGSRE